MSKKENTKLTLKVLLERKEQVLNAKKSRASSEMYIKSLDGVITVVEPDKSIIAEANEFEGNMGDIYSVYECVTEPPLKSKELQDAFGCVEPMEIVEKLFKPGEIAGIVKELLNLAGFTEDSVQKVTDGVKN